MKLIISLVLILLVITLFGCRDKNIVNQTCRELCDERGFSNAQCIKGPSLIGWGEKDVNQEKKAFNSTMFCEFDALTPIIESKDSPIGWQSIYSKDCNNKKGLFELGGIRGGRPTSLCCCS